MSLILTGESMGELLLVFGTVFIATYFLYRRQNVNDSGHKLPPTMWSLPIIGSLPFLPTTHEDIAKFGISPRNKLGKFFAFRVGSKFCMMISDKKAIREALVTKSTYFADRPLFYFDSVSNPRMKGIFGSPLYTTKFVQHHKLCLSILKRFGFGQRVMETRILMEVEEMITRIQAHQGRSSDISQLIVSCAANVIMNMVFGRRFDHSCRDFQQLISDSNELFSDIPVELEVLPILRSLPYYKKKMAENVATMKRVCDYISLNIATCVEDKMMSESFVHYFIKAQGPDYDKEQLLFTIRDLIEGGMESTATVIRWAIVLLTNHVSVQERLHAEIDSVVGRDRLPSLDDRSRMPYVEAMILEVLRYTAVFSFVLRSIRLNTEVGGYFVPQGTLVVVNLYAAHMDPEDWHLPQQFRPERFLDDSGNVIGRDRIVAFGLGKRSCIAEQLARQEIFLFLVALLQKFYFKPPEGHEKINVHEIWGLSVAPSVYEVRMIGRG